MAVRIEWVEDLLGYISEGTTTMRTKIGSGRDVRDPDNYRTTIALELVKVYPRFFEDFKVLEERLDSAAEISSRLAGAIDQAMANLEPDSER